MKKLFLIIILIGVSFCGIAMAELVCKSCQSIDVSKENGLYIFKIPYNGNNIIEPYVSKKLVTNKNIYNTTNAELVVNGGYFDVKNEKTNSYVVLDGEIVLSPEDNENFMGNETLKPYIKQILNRTEFRVLSCRGKLKYDITAHSTKIPFRCKLLHSLQAGPLVYPTLRLEDEAFLTKKNGNVIRDSIQAEVKRPRTAIGIKDKDIYIIVATLFHPLTLQELSEVCAKLKLDKAMNLDGGGSTSVDYKASQNPTTKSIHVVSEKNNTARKLKSFLVVY